MVGSVVMPDPVTSGGQQRQRRVLAVLWRGVWSAILDNRDTHVLYYNHYSRSKKQHTHITF